MFGQETCQLMNSSYCVFRNKRSQPLMMCYSFGFLDGVSHPAVEGFHTNPNPGQETVRQGIILLGREGDQPNVPGATQRPPWALDGSFLCFRYLGQRVPEFNKFLTENALTINDPSAPPDLGRELLGARLVGRWRSGTWSCILAPASWQIQADARIAPRSTHRCCTSEGRPSSRHRSIPQR